ncbi:MAG: transcriptional regulator, NifA subfamily, Fis Family [Candidatus Solibacter sp.]|nr:transcriptional regulator, NifA subfamily, Fis Family [Candidatus Solibacter sp.]
MVATPGIRAASLSERPSSERYEALIRVSQAIGAHRDPKELFRAMTTELHRVIQFDGIVVAQYDEASNEVLWNACEVCNKQNAVPPSDIPADETITKWVYQRQEPLVIPALDQETRFPRMIAFLRSKGFQSICALPLTTIHRRIGSLAVASKHTDAYCEEEVRFLSLVADQAALAIDDALNFDASRVAQAALQHKNDRLRLLLEVNNTIVSNLELRDLLRAISASIRSVMQCDGVGVALPDGESKQLRVYAFDFPNSKGLAREDILIPANEDSPAARAFQNGEPASILSTDIDRIDPLAAAEGLKSLCHIPLISRNRTVGLLSLARLEPIPFSPRDIEFLSLVANQVAIAVENALAYQEISTLKDRLAQEKVYLEDEIRSELNFEEIVGRSQALRSVLQEIETVAPTDSTVLIYGETGTGKELIARAIHNLSSRSNNSFVKLNCAAIPTGLLESEMFGHERGAFTGAVAQRIGRFELAHHGTVFLDEIGEIPLELQPKLLRVLQEREFERLGSSRTLRTDARLIAATNRDLGTMVEDQKFRADLFYRLNVFPVQVPPLRERPDDIPLLVRHFVQQFARRMGKAVDTIPTETMNVLVRYHWPGNIRELQNLLERAVILSAGPILKVPLNDLQAQPAPSTTRKAETLEVAERRHILEALDAAGWVISGPNGAASALGLKRSTLQARMEKLGIRRARAAAQSRVST